MDNKDGQLNMWSGFALPHRGNVGARKRTHKSQLTLWLVLPVRVLRGLYICVDKTDLNIVKTPVTTEQFLKGQRPEGDQQVAFVLLNPLGEFKSYKGAFPPESGLGSNRVEQDIYQCQL